MTLALTKTTHTHNFDKITRAARDSFALDLARLTLSLGVPIEIDHLRKSGGPFDYQIETAQNFIQQQKLGEAVMFASEDETREQMRILIEILAIMAFQPGGVSCFGLHWEAESEVCS